MNRLRYIIQLTEASPRVDYIFTSLSNPNVIPFSLICPFQLSSSTCFNSCRTIEQMWQYNYYKHGGSVLIYFRLHANPSILQPLRDWLFQRSTNNNYWTSSKILSKRTYQSARPYLYLTLCHVMFLKLQLWNTLLQNSVIATTLF